MAGQLHFTNAAPRPGRPGGFRTVAASPSLDAEALRRMERLCAYETPTRSAAAEPGGPVAFGYRDGCLVRCVNLGLDHTGRPGNLFGHVVRAGEAELGGLRPIELWASPLWRDRPADGALPEVGRLEPGRGPRTEDVARLVAGGGATARDALAACVEYAVGLLRQAEDVPFRPLVLVTRSTDLAVGWLAALSFSLPESLAGALTFTTYAARPASAGVHVAVTVPEVRDRGGPEIPVLDLDALLGSSADGTAWSGAAEWGGTEGASGPGGWAGSDGRGGRDGWSGYFGEPPRDGWAGADERPRVGDRADSSGRARNHGPHVPSEMLAPHGTGRYAAAVADAWSRRDFAVVDLLTTWHAPSGNDDPESSPPLAVATLLAGQPVPASTAGAAARWLGEAGPSLDPEILGRLVELEPLPAPLARAMVELAGVGAYSADARGALAVARQLKRLLDDGATTPEDLVALVRRISGSEDARAARAGGGPRNPAAGVGGARHPVGGGAHDRRGAGTAAAAGGLPGVGDGSGGRGTGGAHGRHGGAVPGSVLGRHGAANAARGLGDVGGTHGGRGDTRVSAGGAAVSPAGVTASGGAGSGVGAASAARLPWLDPVALREAADRCGRAYPERIGSALYALLPSQGTEQTDAEDALMRGFVDVLGDEARPAHGERRALNRVDSLTGGRLARFLTSDKLALWREVPELACEIFSRPPGTADKRRLATVWLVWLGDHGVARRRVADGLEAIWGTGTRSAREVLAAVDATAADAAAVPVLLDLVYRALRLEHPGDQDQVTLAHWVLTRGETDPAPPGGRRVAEVCAELTLAVNDVAQCITKFGRSARQTREATAAARHWQTHAPYPHAQAAEEILTHLYEPRRRPTATPPAAPTGAPTATPEPDGSAKPKRAWPLPRLRGKPDPPS